MAAVKNCGLSQYGAGLWMFLDFLRKYTMLFILLSTASSNAGVLSL